LVSGIGWLDKSYIARGGVEGREPLHPGSELRESEGCQEFGEIGVALDAVEAALDMEKGGGSPAGDLVGLQAPAGDPGGLAAVIPHDVLYSDTAITPSSLGG
jgi:hypothetical protein